MLRVAIFDLDQTIWNSEPLYACVGGDEASSPVADRLRSAGLSPRSWSQFIQKHSDLTQLYEGIAGSLANLQKEGVRLAIATNLPAWVGRPLLDHHQLSDVFEAQAFNERHSHPKPSPEPVLRLGQAMRLSFVSEDIVLVGDSMDDRRCANAAGIRFAHALWGLGGDPLASEVIVGSQRYSSVEDLTSLFDDLQ